MANVIFKLEISQNRKRAAKKSPKCEVEVINIKAQIKGKFGHVVQIQVCRLPYK